MTSAGVHDLVRRWGGDLGLPAIAPLCLAGAVALHPVPSDDRVLSGGAMRLAVLALGGTALLTCAAPRPDRGGGCPGSGAPGEACEHEGPFAHSRRPVDASRRLDRIRPIDPAMPDRVTSCVTACARLPKPRRVMAA